MKKRIIFLCSFFAFFLLSSCGSTAAPQENSSTNASNVTEIPSDITDAVKTTEQTTSLKDSKVTTTAVTATKQISVTTSAKTDSVTTEMFGTGGDIENEMYKLEGFWETSNHEQILHIVNNTFTLSRNGELLRGYLSHTDKDLPNSFALAENESGLTNGRYVRRDTDRFARLILTEDGIDTDLIFAGDLIPSLLYSETGKYTYNGVQYTDPVTIELIARADIRNVKLLKLTFVELDDQKAPLYDGEVVLELPDLANGASFTPIIEIPGSIPAYGISYEDEHGKIHYFDIGLSGVDNSIVLSPFKNVRDF